MHTTPLSLLERLRQPAASRAWDQFVELYTPLFFTWTRRLGLREDDAADLIQEVFVVLVSRLPEFRHDGRQSFRSWLWTVLLNKWRDQRRRPVSPHASPEALANLAEADPVEALITAEYQQHLARRALQLMQRDFQPPTWKACWETVVEGRPAADVAAELGLRPAAVYSATARVLRRLREELDEFLD